MGLHNNEDGNWLREHPVNQSVQSLIVVQDDYERSIEGIRYDLGSNGVSKIEPTIKSGEYASIPYFRVWMGDDVKAEVCQHRCVLVLYRTEGSTS